MNHNENNVPEAIFPDPARLPAYRASGRRSELKSFYKLTYLAAAVEAGLLKQLAAGPATLNSLAESFVTAGQGKDAFEAWLQMWVRLRLLSLRPRGYALRGLAKVLARPENDPALAIRMRSIRVEPLCAAAPWIIEKGMASNGDMYRASGPKYNKRPNTEPILRETSSFSLISTVEQKSLETDRCRCSDAYGQRTQRHQPSRQEAYCQSAICNMSLGVGSTD